MLWPIPIDLGRILASFMIETLELRFFPSQWTEEEMNPTGANATEAFYVHGSSEKHSISVHCSLQKMENIYRESSIR